MCGISGYINFSKKKLELNLSKKIIQTLKNRGPDGFGIFEYNSSTNKQKIYFNQIQKTKNNFNICLYHTRLSIIDLNERASQPMQTQNKDYTISFNGEIYNFKYLKKILIKLGYKFFTNSDTEVLLKGYEEYGVEIFNKIEGMFAISIFDKKQKKLILARDPFGIKPLYYYITKDFFCFGSTPRTLFSYNLIKKKPNLNLIYNFMINNTKENDQNSFFKDIYQVKQGSYLSIDTTNFKIKKYQYWNLDKIKSSKKKFNLEQLIINSVKNQMISDVPLTISLSGGLDSSIIAYEVSKIRNKNSSFSFCSKNFLFNEEREIDKISKKFNFKSHKIYPNSINLEKTFRDLIYYQEEPFSSLTIFAQYMLFKNVKINKFKVILDGQGSDEIFGGYREFLLARLIDELMKFNLFNVIKLIKNIIAYPKIFSIDSLTFIFKNFLNLNFFSNKIINYSYYQQSKKKKEIKKYSFFKELVKRKFSSTSLPHLLRIGDRNSMAHSIENRFPFLDKKIIQFAFKLDDNKLVSNSGEYKKILKDIYKYKLPAIIVNKKHRIGFFTPMDKWIFSRRNFFEKIIISKTAKNLKIINQSELLKEWNYFKKTKKLSQILIRAIILIKWFEVFRLRTE